MSGEDRTGLVEVLLGPVLLPRRALEALEALGAAARTVEELGTELRGLRLELNGELTRVQATLEAMDAELASTRRLVQDIKEQTSDITDRLPDPDAAGPIARARDAIVGSDR